MALTSDRKTPMRDGESIALEVAASTKIYAGGMVAVNSSGYAVPAADAAGLKVMGRVEEYVDNSAGGDGDKTVMVRRKKAFRFKNSSSNAVTTAHIGSDIYVEDDETVSSSGGTNNIKAGKCLGVETSGVWVEIA